MINIRPTYLIQVNWKEETDGFNCKRMMYIIKGIKNNEVCNMVKDYITTSWYETCNECFLYEKEDASLFNSNGGWRFVPVEDGVKDEYKVPTIDDVIKEMTVQVEIFKRWVNDPNTEYPYIYATEPGQQ
jgi:hypothetical protein